MDQEKIKKRKTCHCELCTGNVISLEHSNDAVNGDRQTPAQMSLDAGHWIKLREAIQIVVKDQLKNNADDTLVEKLIACVEGIVIKTDDDDKMIELLDLVLESVKQTKAGLGTALRLIGVNLQKESIFTRNHQAVHGALDMISQVATTVEQTEFTVQAGFLKCLLRISSHLHGTNWIITSKLSSDSSDMPKIVDNLFRSSKSYFVRREAERLILQLIINHYRACHTTLPYIDDLKEDLSVQNLKFLQSLINELESKAFNEHIKTSLIEKFPDVVNKSDHDQLMTFISTLGLVLEGDDAINFLTTVKESSIDADDKGELTRSLVSQILANDQLDKNTVRNLSKIWSDSFIKTITNTDFKDSKRQLTAFTKLTEQLARNLDIDDNYEHFTYVIINFIDQKLTTRDRNFKLISAAISALGRCKLNYWKIMHRTVRLLNKMSDKTHRINLLKTYRDFLMSKEPHKPRSYPNESMPNENSPVEEFKPFCDAFADYVQQKCIVRYFEVVNEMEEAEGYEEIDSLCEVINALMLHLKYHSFVNYGSRVLDSFFKLFSVHRDNPMFKISAVPILIELDHNILSTYPKNDAANEQPIEFKQFETIPLLLFDWINFERPSLSEKIIDELIVNIDRFEKDAHMNPPWLTMIFLERPEIFYDKLLTNLCQFALLSVDTDLQRKAIKLLTRICRDVVLVEDLTKTQQDLYKAGLFHCVHQLYTNKLEDSNKLFDDLRKLRQALVDLLFINVPMCQALRSLTEFDEFISLNKEKTGLENGSGDSILTDDNKIVLEEKSQIIPKEQTMNTNEESNTKFEKQKDQSENDLLAKEVKTDNPVLSTEQKINLVDDLFRGYVNQPTLDLIDELNQRSNKKQPDEPKQNDNATVEMKKMTLKEVLEVFYSSNSKQLERHANELSPFSILDDVIAAKRTENAASMDCY